MNKQKHIFNLILVLLLLALTACVSRPEQPVDTPSPEPSFAVSLTPAEASATPVSTETPTPTATLTPTVTSMPSATNVPTATTEPKVTNAPTATAEPKVTNAPTATDAPVVTKAPTATPTTFVPYVPTSTPTPYVIKTGLTADQVAEECGKLYPRDETRANIAVQIIIKNLIKPEMKDYEKVCIIHDYLVLYADYDYDNYKKNKVPYLSGEAAGCLIAHVCVCDGYSKAFNMIMNELGIECFRILGDAKGDGGWEFHAWNAVHLDDDWYYVDVTWDDPHNGDLSHKYLLVPESVIADNHKPDMWANSDDKYHSDMSRFSGKFKSDKYADIVDKAGATLYPGAHYFESAEEALTAMEAAFRNGDITYAVGATKTVMRDINNKFSTWFSDFPGIRGDFKTLQKYKGTNYETLIFKGFVSCKQYVETKYPTAIYAESYDKLKEILLSKYQSGAKEVLIYWDADMYVVNDRKVYEINLDKVRKELIAACNHAVVAGIETFVPFPAKTYVYYVCQLSFVPYDEYLTDCYMYSDYPQFTDYESLKNVLQDMYFNQKQQQFFISTFRSDITEIFAELDRAASELGISNRTHDWFVPNEHNGYWTYKIVLIN